MRKPSKRSTILAAVIWIISLILAFRIPPSSSFIWLPDALLLLGFYPLFISTKSPWLWFIFGLIDTFVGFMLLIVRSAPKEELVRLHVLEINAHMQSYHPYYVWTIIGILSTIIGLAQLQFRLFVWLYGCLMRRKQNR